jgi:nickel/cobalt exporter
MLLNGVPAYALRQLAIALAAIAVFLLLAGAVDGLLAQGTPFGASKGSGGGPACVAAAHGLVNWVMCKQGEFYRALSGSVRAAKTDGFAVWILLGLSFAYGIFHAAGPGHGKAVISSYVVANRETWWRGIVLSFASAMVQAAVAVAVVGIAAVLLNATAATMRTAVRWIEITSYLLIMAIGLRLIWVKGHALVSELRNLRKPKTVGAAATPAHLHDGRRGHAHHAHHHDHEHDHKHDHGGDGHPHHSHDRHGHDRHAHHHHAHGHGEASAWGHAHAPEPEELAGPGGWRRGLGACGAVGLRPCSGAILILVFTLAQGLFWAGVLATFVMGIGTAITVAVIATLAVFATAWAERFSSSRGGAGMLFMRSLEVGAAVVITGFGALLLVGYMASERLL